jgi:thiol-disulfide isomerase/thioredoxin
MKHYVFVFLISLTFSNVIHGQKKDINPLDIGGVMPTFNLKGVDDKMHSSYEYNADILCIIFTCNHCPTAQAYEDKLIKIEEDYSPRGVQFVAISPNDPKAVALSELGYSDLGDDLEDMKIRAKEKNYNFPYLYDGDTQETTIKFGPLATPHVFVFDKQRKLQYSGRIDDTENPYILPNEKNLIDALDALVQNKVPEVQQTKTFGCSIKWAWKNEWALQELANYAKQEVTLKDIDLADINTVMKPTEKLRLVNVWATWCGPCVMEFPAFVEIDRMYRGRDFDFVSISTDKKNLRNKALEKLKEFQAANVNYRYAGEDIYALIEAVDKDWQGTLPYTALIAPGGEIIFKIEGTIDPQDLKKRIVEYLGRYYADN